MSILPAIGCSPYYSFFLSSSDSYMHTYMIVVCNWRLVHYAKVQCPHYKEMCQFFNSFSKPAYFDILLDNALVWDFQDKFSSTIILMF